MRWFIAMVRCAVLLVGLANRGNAAEPVTVHLSSGRSFSAFVDSKTDNEKLWLRFEGAGTLVLRPIDWSRITGAEFRGETLTVAKFKSIVDSLATATDYRLHLSNPATTNPLQLVAPATSASVQLEVARSVDFDARVANWDDDVNMDGLLLHVYPLNADDQSIPVSGTLEVNLIGVRYKDFAAAPQSGGYTLDRLGRWTQSIRPEDWTARGVVVRLPFQSVDPESNTQIGWYGVVNVRLAIPGQGVFEASHDGIRLRPSAPVRDAYERQRERRFFPIERIGP